jgi:hypothetical protein
LQEFGEVSTCNLRWFRSHKKQDHEFFPILEHRIIEVVNTKADALILLDTCSKFWLDLKLVSFDSNKD